MDEDREYKEEEKEEEIVEDTSVEEQGDSGPDVDYSESKVQPPPPVEKKSRKAQKAAKKTIFTAVRRVTTIGTKAGTIFIVEDEDGIGYIAPGDTKFVRGQADLDVSVLEKAYDWTNEIEAMLPDREVLVHNIRRSIWISGGYGRKQGRKSRRMDHAWPYRLPEDVGKDG